MFLVTGNRSHHNTGRKLNPHFDANLLKSVKLSFLNFKTINLPVETVNEQVVIAHIIDLRCDGGMW